MRTLVLPGFVGGGRIDLMVDIEQNSAFAFRAAGLLLGQHDVHEASGATY